MPVQGIGNFFDLGSIKSLAGGSATSKSGSSTGGTFDLGNSSSGSSSNNIGEGNLGLGDVSAKDQNVESALNSVAGESAIQQQFRNQLALVNLQERVQSQSRTVEILTNILKARHDASLSAARNVK